MAVAYGHNLAVCDVTAEVPRGSVVGLIGPNGSGKSTLLKAIAGSVPLSAGSIRFGGQPAGRFAGRIAYVPQREEVNWDFPVTARDVVAMGRYRALGWLRWPGRRERAAADAALAALGLEGMGDRHISQFSGGQQQRIFLARAMVQEPELVLLDEPFTGVDVRNREVFHAQIHRFAEAGVTVLVATHDLDEVRATTTHVLLLNRRMVAFGPTAATFTPANLRAAFGGQVAVFEQVPVFERAP
ncbi:metal ABC transporter ATP-binding protein [Tepidiforma sp.]|uniref:metal ABC transporter ATP-binding protein n=1 Tax=Tepidiforma sp. TaxID=2682230 RepID=UPI002619325A|nr:metal ABC transporter ATP-binding protein [Tepidiforma sp.]MCX7618657.1 metal ABC transporter ATP-binding protein [Tepidiforma sp.]